MWIDGFIVMGVTLSDIACMQRVAGGGGGALQADTCDDHQLSLQYCRFRQHRYCGRDCQVKHWPSHKLMCGQHMPMPTPAVADADATVLALL